VDRPDEPRGPLDEDQCLLLVPGMVAQSHRVRARIDEIAVDRFGDAEPAGRVLAVDDDAIELPAGDQARQAIEHDGAAALAHDVADGQEAHRSEAFRQSITSRSVSTRSSRASWESAGTASISCIAKARPTAVIGFMARNPFRVRS